MSIMTQGKDTVLFSEMPEYQAMLEEKESLQLQLDKVNRQMIDFREKNHWMSNNKIVFFDEDPLYGTTILLADQRVDRCVHSPYEFANEIEWIQTIFNVSEEKYTQWKSWVEGGRKCQSLTKAGRPCGGFPTDNSGKSPESFDPAFTPYCGHHKDPDKRISPEDLSDPLPIPHRYAVLKAAGFRCQACGASSSEAKLEIDHIHPRSKGGSDDIENLQVLCKSCNCSKGDRIYDDAGAIQPR